MSDFTTPNQQDGLSPQEAHSTDERAVEEALAELAKQAGIAEPTAQTPSDEQIPTNPQQEAPAQDAAVQQAVEQAITDAQQGDDTALQDLLQRVDESTLDRILQERNFDITKIRFFRQWQSKFDRQLAEERRQRQALEAKLRALQEQQALQDQLSQAKTEAERLRILQEFAQRKAEEPIQAAERQAAIERLREWDEYYTTQLGVPPEAVNQVSMQLINELKARYPGREIPLDEFHRLRDSAITVLARTIAKKEQQTPTQPVQQQTPPQPQQAPPQPQQTPQPPQQQQPAVDAHNPDVTVTPGQGLAGEVSLEELWARGDFETLAKRIRDMGRG